METGHRFHYMYTSRARRATVNRSSQSKTKNPWECWPLSRGQGRQNKHPSTKQKNAGCGLRRHVIRVLGISTTCPSMRYVIKWN